MLQKYSLICWYVRLCCPDQDRSLCQGAGMDQIRVNFNLLSNKILPFPGSHTEIFLASELIYKGFNKFFWIVIKELESKKMTEIAGTGEPGGLIISFTNKNIMPIVSLMLGY